MAYDSTSRRISFPVPPVPKRRRLGNDSPWYFTKAPLITGAVVWLVIPVLLAIWRLFLAVCLPGFGGLHNSFDLWLQRNLFAVDGGFLGLSGTNWMVLTFVSLITAFVVGFVGQEDDGISLIEGTTIIFNVVLCLLSISGWIFTMTANGPDAATFNNRTTTIRVADLNNPPTSLSLLYHKSAPRQTSADGKTLTFGDFATVTQGTLPDYVWDPRSSSLSGAQKWLENKSPSVQGVDTWDDTFTYVYATTAGNSRWSVVLDGSGRSRSTYGVSEWRGGQSTVHVCTFDDSNGNGDYKFTRAFNGSNSNSLRNVIAKAYPGQFFKDEDVSGYCDDNNKPVITISMLKNVGAGSVTGVAPACLLVLKGSPTGFPDMNCLHNVQSGQFPVPVYPLSLVSTQRDAIDWAAGRGNKNGANFGYEPSSYASQASNDSDYILRDTVTGKIYAVTPSKFNKTKSQSYVLYQIEEVDTLTDGQLNHMDAYAQQDDDQAVNPAQLDINAHIYMGWVMKQSGLSEFLPITFFSDGGNIEEYVPLSKTVFRGYGVDKLGATRFYIDISTDPKVDPVVTILDIAASSPVVKIQVPSEVAQIGNGQLLQPSVTITCNGKDAKGASPDKLAACLQAYQDELIRQLKAAPTAPAQLSGSPTTVPTPAPSGSPTGG